MCNSPADFSWLGARALDVMSRWIKASVRAARTSVVSASTYSRENYEACTKAVLKDIAARIAANGNQVLALNLAAPEA